MEYDWPTKYFSDGDKDHDLFQLFGRCYYLTKRARERELQRYTLTPEQVQVLFFVRIMKERATPAEISRVVLRKPHTVSSLVNRMVKRGLLTKREHKKYKNWISLEITEKGEEYYQFSAKRGPIRRILSALSEEERSVFKQLLEKVSEKAADELGLTRIDLPPSE